MLFALRTIIITSIYTTGVKNVGGNTDQMQVRYDIVAAAAADVLNIPKFSGSNGCIRCIEISTDFDPSLYV